MQEVCKSRRALETIGVSWSRKTRTAKRSIPWRWKRVGLFVDLTPNDSSMPDSFNSEEDGPLFLHMAGKLDKRNDKKRGSGTRTFNAAKNPVQSRRMTTTASSSNALNRWGNNALRIDTSGPNLMDRKDASQPQKAGSSLKRMSPSKMLLSPSCPNLSQMAKGASRHLQE